MVFIISLIILAALFSFLLSLIPLSNWFLFLWIPLGILLSLICVVAFIVLFIRFNTKTSITGKLKHKFLHQLTQLITIVTNIRVKTIGFENIPDETCVFYGNHKSNIDPVLTYYAMGKVCSAVGKSTLFTNKFMIWLKDCFGAISLDRNNDREAAKAMIQAIKHVNMGLSMIIYPEGGIKTRETECCVDVKPGAYKLATKPGVPIVPVTILNSHTICTKKLFQKHNVTIVFHKPIYKEDYQNLNTIELGNLVEGVINSAVTNK
jgi:1-acyl-sn-glycerol-3-phosphate acyltransferase